MASNELDDDGDYTVPSAANFRATENPKLAIEKEQTKDAPNAHVATTDTSSVPGPSTSTANQSNATVMPVVDKSLAEFNKPEILTRYFILRSQKFT